jgi:hypothetical protein
MAGTKTGGSLANWTFQMRNLRVQLEQAIENTPIPPPRAASGLAAARFARDPRDYRPTLRSTPRPDWLHVIDGVTTEQEQEGMW